MDAVFTITGREFVCGKKEMLKISFFALGTTNMGSFLHYLVLGEKTVRLWESLAVFLLDARVYQSSFCIISAMLA